MKFTISDNIYQTRQFKGLSFRDCLGLDKQSRFCYSIPSAVVGGGNTSTGSNVFRVSFSQPLSATPLYQMWDNGSTYPAVDAGGATTVKEAFTGTTGNSSIPEYSLVSTTSSAPTSNWMPSSATGGSANPNRMKGTTNYVTDPTTPTNASIPVVTSTTATPASGAGMSTGAYKYTITYVVGTAGLPLGETLPSAEISVTTTSGNDQVAFTGIPTGPGGTLYRNLYRTQVGGSSNTEKFVHQIADNTTTTYTDTASDTSIVGNAAEPTIDTSASIRFNMTANFGFDSSVPSSSSQNILLQIQYQYLGSAPSLTYWYNDSTLPGTDAAPSWTQLTPGSAGIRPVNSGTTIGTYKFTLPASGTSTITTLWVTAT